MVFCFLYLYLENTAIRKQIFELKWIKDHSEDNNFYKCETVSLPFTVLDISAKDLLCVVVHDMDDMTSESVQL